MAFVPVHVVHYQRDVEQKRKPRSTAQEQNGEDGVSDALWEDRRLQLIDQLFQVRVFPVQLNKSYDLDECKRHEKAGKDQG